METALPMRVAPVACLAPPPGLENELTPMKVIPGPRRKVQLDKNTWINEQGSTNPFATNDNGGKSAGWLNAALATAPNLDKQGLKQALQILESALVSMKQAKVQEEAKGDLQKLQQQQLLQQLCALAPPGADQAASAPRLAPAVMTAATKRMAGAPPGLPEPRGTQAAVDVRKQAQAKGQASLSDPAGRQTHTLSASLQMLANVDPTCLLIVRRINKLGFKASRKLKQHFATYGAVVRVLVAHSTVKQQGDPSSRARRRPSSLGFVHMATPSAVAEILKLGENQDIAGSVIRVQRFERHGYTSLEADVEDDEADGDLEEEPSELAVIGKPDSTMLRQTTTCSMASTGVSCESEASWHSSE